MKTILIQRPLESTDQGTFGILRTEGFSCGVLELPWRNNERNISCIPEGIYEVIPLSKKFGQVFLINTVRDRGGILIHSGNFAGDVSKNYLTHSQGCLLLGKEKTFFGNNKQYGITLSKTTVRRFNDFIGKEKFTLTIEGGGNYV